MPRHKIVWLATGAFLALVYWAFIRPSLLAPQNRDTLVAFADKSRLGDSTKTVRQTFQADYSRSRITFREYDSHCWAFETPLEFGATNWILLVSFDGNAVDGIGIRTADSLKGKPRDAPADRVNASASKSWKARFGPDRES